jgi:hypothetical protein
MIQQVQVVIGDQREQLSDNAASNGSNHDVEVVSFQIPRITLDQQVVDCFKSNRQQECEAQPDFTASISLVVHPKKLKLLQLEIERFSRKKSWLAIKESGSPIMRQATAATEMTKWFMEAQKQCVSTTTVDSCFE